MVDREGGFEICLYEMGWLGLDSGFRRNDTGVSCGARFFVAGPHQKGKWG